MLTTRNIILININIDNNKNLATQLCSKVYKSVNLLKKSSAKLKISTGDSSLEQIVETDIIPKFLTITIIESASHLYRNHEVAVHHDLQATTCSCMQLLFVA